MAHPTSLTTDGRAVGYEGGVSPTGAGRSAAAAAITAAAQGLTAALAPEQRKALHLPFEDPGRRSWHYTPGSRPGVSLAEMDRVGGKAVHTLLGTALSASAHTRVSAIVGLEDVLDESEGGKRGRHAGDYWSAVFGEPGTDPWGWRFEGHHVSINVTVAGGAVSATPCFFGANPATVTDNEGRTISRPLAPEEDVAEALLASLDSDQRERAIIGRDAPADILTGEATEVGGRRSSSWAEGLPATALRPNQLSLLRSLAAIYVNRLSTELADPLLARLDRDLPAFCFAWAGPVDPGPGQPHYYRLDGPRFLVEFDNRQNGANHIHSVWRDPEGDFGARLLPEDDPGVS
jgi:Protein of unknown function (DUF3500)